MNMLLRYNWWHQLALLSRDSGSNFPSNRANWAPTGHYVPALVNTWRLTTQRKTIEILQMPQVHTLQNFVFHYKCSFHTENVHSAQTIRPCSFNILLFNSIQFFFLICSSVIIYIYNSTQWELFKHCSILFNMVRLLNTVTGTKYNSTFQFLFYLI